MPVIPLLGVGGVLGGPHRRDRDLKNLELVDWFSLLHLV